MIRSLRFVECLFAAFILTACNISLVADVTPPPGYQSVAKVDVDADSGLLFPLVPSDPVKGQPIYLEECAVCHGETGLGDGPNASSLPVPVVAIGDYHIARLSTPAEWFRVVTQGNLVRSMPPFRSLTDRQRWDAVAYIYSLSLPYSDLAGYQQLYRENCDNCHGNRGEGNGEDALNLVLPDFTDQETMAVKSITDFFRVITNGSQRGMPSFSERLAEDDRWELAHYVRSLTFLHAKAAESVESASLPQQEDSISANDSIVPVPTKGARQGMGSVSGKVINGSVGKAPTGLEIHLYSLDQRHGVLTSTTTLMEDGAFLFKDVEIEVGLTYQTSVTYEGVLYSSEAIMVEDAKESIYLPLQVYETTTDSSILEIERLHYFLELLPEQSGSGFSPSDYAQAGEKTLRVVELFIFSNPGLKTVVAPQRGQPVIIFNLPKGASNLELRDGSLGDRYLKTPDGFGDTTPVRPGMGSYQIMFTYTMPYSEKMNLTWPITFPIEALVILAPENNLTIEGSDIRDLGIRELQGVRYQEYEGLGFLPGRQLNLTITDRSSRNRMTLNVGSRVDLYVGLATFGIVLIILAAQLYRRQVKRPRTANISAGSSRPVSENPETIMDAILALDDLYQEGSLPEDAYLQRRTELKTYLKGLLGS